MGVLKWKDPWQRDYTEINVLYDTGLCNRIFHWEIANHINSKFHNNEFTISVEESQWPELEELITLPNTSVISKEDEIKYFNNLSDIPITNWKTLGDIFTKKSKLDSTKNYISKYPYTDLGCFYAKDFYGHSEHNEETMFLENRPLSSVKLKNESNQKIVEKITSDLVGVHIRRSRGVKIPKELYEKDEYSEYINFRKEQGAIEHSIFKYHSDEEYFKLFDSILELNPNQKFYLSYDVPKKYMKNILDKYKNVLITKDDLKKELDLTNIKNSKEMHLNNVVDLFGLSNTKFLIAYPVSTWSVFAYEYKNKKRNFIHDDLGWILSRYERLLKQKI